MLLMTACSNDEGTPAVTTIPKGDQPVMFNAALATGGSGTTRANNQVNDIANLKSVGGFGVFACYTGLHGYSDSNAHPDFMYNDHVTWDNVNNVWTYSPIKYWPNGEGEADGVTGSNKHYVSFFAYAPYSDNASGATGYCIPSFSQQQEIGNPWLTYRLHTDVAQQVDLLCASPLIDQSKPASVSEHLLFNFSHALACVGDRIKLRCSDEMKSTIAAKLADGSVYTNVEVLLTDVSITYTLTEKGRLVLWNGGEMNWETILSEAPQTTRTVNIISGTAQQVYVKAHDADATVNHWEDTGHGVFYIPIELSTYPQKALISVTYQVRYTKSAGGAVEDPSVTGTATIILNGYPNAYQPGKHLYFDVTVDNVAVRVSGSIAPWDATTVNPTITETD